MAKKKPDLFPPGTLFLSVAIPPTDELFHRAFITARRDERASLHQIDYASMEQLMEGLATCASRLAEIEAQQPAAAVAAAEPEPSDQLEGRVRETRDEEELEITFFDAAGMPEETPEPHATQGSLF